MRKELALFAAIAALFTFIALSAQAMPISSLNGVSNADQITPVSGGCGPHRHRGPRGHCRPG
jgi:Spy/CpxP family protein refolding chaperone